MTVVECREVTRRFGDVSAVDGVSFAVAQGEIFGLVGPNGAGKTTLLNCIEGLDRAGSGTIRVLGLDPISDRRALATRLGVQLQSAALPPRITVAEAMKLYSAFYADPLPWPGLLERLGVSEKQHTRIERLSGGQRQRVFIGLALLHSPELVFLDELTTALDPQARLAMWDVVSEIRDRGATVVLTTHYMEEAEHLCDQVGIMDQGQLIALDTVPGLIRDHAGDSRADILLHRVPRSDLGLDRLREVTKARLDGNRLTVHGYGGFLQDVMNVLTQRGERVADLRATSPSLEDVFLNLTGRQMQRESAS